MKKMTMKKTLLSLSRRHSHYRQQQPTKQIEQRAQFDTDTQTHKHKYTQIHTNTQSQTFSPGSKVVTRATVESS